MSENRLIEIENRLAFQEDHIQALNQSMLVMQKQIDRLETLCQMLKSRLGEMEKLVPVDSVLEQKPPHY